MSEEEKEAIKVLNNFNATDCGIEETQAIETILTLIEKQQKEVEDLNKKIQRIYDTQRMIDISDLNKSHISFN